MKQSDDLTSIRRDYQSSPFDLQDLDPSPVNQFSCWFEQYRQLAPSNATAMVLATASTECSPSARVVLLKHYDREGFCWYSDYRSRKGVALAANPQAELLFYWPELDRQVRIFGGVQRLDRSFAERYFSERPRGSQLSAAASYQSQPIADRSQLEQQVDRLSRRYLGQSVPCPELWGGYRLVPLRYEFWQGRENRLHDRLVYSLDPAGVKESRDESGCWSINRLAP
tara:strand:- start:1434 stop:2111 length:678 start_codon:yes stop_codon:yes gene_type:complete